MEKKKLKASIFTLHKYFIWASQMREDFYALVPEFAAKPERDRFSKEALLIDMYMSL